MATRTTTAPAAKRKAAGKATINPAATAAAKKAPAKKAARKLATKAVVKPTKPAAEAVKSQKAPKLKLVRDSFTMPRSDFDLVDVLKARAIDFKRPAKKSELLRAGLHALAAMGDVQLKAALDALVALRPGRPKKAD